MRKFSLHMLFRFALIVAALGAAACDTTGVHELRKPRDVIVACSAATSTWLRTTDSGTELYLIGSTVPTAATPTATSLCFARALIKFDSTTDLETGFYTLDATGHGTFRATTSYQFLYQPNIGVLNRRGSTRTDNDPNVLHSLQIAASGAEIVLTEDGAARRLTDLYDLVDVLDPTTQAGAEDMFKVLNLPLFLSQVRVDGFGGGRMTTYAMITATFQAMIANDFSIHVASAFNPDVDIAYNNFQDLSGIVINGVQHTDMMAPLLDGVGKMSGVVDFTMRNGPDAADVLYVGTIDYANLNVDNGVAGSGSYQLSTTVPSVTSHAIPYTVAANVDFRATLPPSTP